MFAILIFLKVYLQKIEFCNALQNLIWYPMLIKDEVNINFMEETLNYMFYIASNITIVVIISSIILCYVLYLILIFTKNQDKDFLNKMHYAYSAVISLLMLMSSIYGSMEMFKNNCS